MFKLLGGGLHHVVALVLYPSLLFFGEGRASHMSESSKQQTPPLHASTGRGAPWDWPAPRVSTALPACVCVRRLIWSAVLRGPGLTPQLCRDLPQQALVSGRSPLQARISGNPQGAAGRVAWLADSSRNSSSNSRASSWGCRWWCWCARGFWGGPSCRQQRTSQPRPGSHQQQPACSGGQGAQGATSLSSIRTPLRIWRGDHVVHTALALVISHQPWPQRPGRCVDVG
jgi:hypothetical protein